MSCDCEFEMVCLIKDWGGMVVRFCGGMMMVIEAGCGVVMELGG